MTDFDYVALYLIVSVGLCGFIAAVWLLCSRPKDSETFVLEQNLGDLIEHESTGWYRTTVGCDVCGIWTPHRTCSECVTWAEMQFISVAMVGAWHKTFGPAAPNEAEHRRLVKEAGW